MLVYTEGRKYIVIAHTSSRWFSALSLVDVSSAAMVKGKRYWYFEAPSKYFCCRGKERRVSVAADEGKETSSGDDLAR